MENSNTQWTEKQKTLARVLWISFLSAAVGFVVIFGLVDPESINLAFSQSFLLSRELGYGLGFLFLFCVAILASGLTAWMLTSSR